MHPVVHSAVADGVSISLSNTYGYVLLAAVIISLEIILIGFFVAGSARSVFTEEFMKQHFGTIHKEATGEDIVKGGAPDMGSGRYSEKLSYQ